MLIEKIYEFRWIILPVVGLLLGLIQAFRIRRSWPISHQAGRNRVIFAVAASVAGVAVFVLISLILTLTGVGFNLEITKDVVLLNITFVILHVTPILVVNDDAF